MKWLCAVVMLIGFVFVRGASADTGFGTAAIVVAVDATAKTITFKHVDSKGAWKQTKATWDEKTTWARAEKEIWDAKPATVDVVKDLKKDSKIYLTVNDRGGKMLTPGSLPSTTCRGCAPSGSAVTVAAIASRSAAR